MTELPPKTESSTTAPVAQAAPLPPAPAAPKPSAPALPLPMAASGTPSWSARRHVTLGFVTLGILFGGFGLWSVATNIAGAVVASGQIEVESQRQVVQHPDGGVVETIAVQEGDTAKAGDLLIKLDGSTLLSELAIVEGQLFEIRARRARLSAERDDKTEVTFPADLIAATKARPEVAELVQGQVHLFNARLETLSRQTAQLAERRAQIGSRITGLDAQRDSLSEQLDLINKELADQQALLDKGLAQASRVLALQREAARLLGQVGEIDASKAEAQENRAETDLEVLRLGASRREEANTQLRDIGSQELELAERRRALQEKIARLEIRAPVAGIVLALQVTTPRSVVRPADQLMYLVPQDRPLVIAARVDPLHIDEVFAGQEAKLHFAAFSSRTTSELLGRVAVVSADALVDQRSQMSYYRVEIIPEPGEMDKLTGLTLLPGMPVEAFIKTGDRSPLQYLLKPFADYFSKAFRES